MKRLKIGKKRKKRSVVVDCFDPMKCRFKQVQARWLVNHGESRTYLKFCAACDRKPTQEEMDKMSAKKEGKCVVCGEVKKLAAGGKCWKCYAAPKEETSSKGISNDGPAVPERVPVQTPAPRQVQKPKPVIVSLNLSKVPGLAEWIVKTAADEIRTPNTQALMVLKNALILAEFGRRNEG